MGKLNVVFQYILPYQVHAQKISGLESHILRKVIFLDFG
jgi:hypothetical protein